MKKISSLILVCAMSLGAYAQDSNGKLLEKLVDKKVLTQSEADQITSDSKSKLAHNTSLVSKAGKVRDAFNTPAMSFSGYGLLMHRYSDVSDVKHKTEPRVVFVNMKGKLTKEISYSILAEFVHPELYELYVDWSPAKEFSVRGGQFKVPFSLENPISLVNLETILNTRSISSLVGMADDVQKLQNGKNNTGRDVGIQLSGSLLPNGDHSMLEYAFGVFQGSGVTSTELNNSKDFAGNVYFQPIKGLRVGGGAYFGEATYLYHADDADVTNCVRNRLAVSADYQSERLYARAEWLKGRDALTDREGVYGTLLYYIKPQKLNVVAKVDYYDMDKALMNTEVTDYTAGINYYFYPQCRLQLNYTRSDYSSDMGQKDSNNVLAQVQIVF
ncbi:MAG: hypothetical protein RL662_637 [Bacteroidota bacterium]|jgi:hypothetical protein